MAADFGTEISGLSVTVAIWMKAEAGHKSYVTIDFVPSSRSSAQKRSVVHHPADIIGIMPQRVNVSASASSSA